MKGIGNVIDAIIDAEGETNEEVPGISDPEDIDDRGIVTGQDEEFLEDMGILQNVVKHTRNHSTATYLI